MNRPLLLATAWRFLQIVLSMTGCTAGHAEGTRGVHEEPPQGRKHPGHAAGREGRVLL